jgi:beta-aspartyl-peptidase (threonine type)
MNSPFRKLGVLVVISLLIIACKNESKKSNDKVNSSIAIVLHGGAGYLTPETLNDSMQVIYREILELALNKGYKVLEIGGSSLEAVKQTINTLEDSPLFNAGKGAVFAHDETNQLDASIMVGNTQNAGAVAGVKRVKNPIDLAIEVMNNSPHVLLTGDGAEQFAAQQGVELVHPSYFFTEKNFERLQKVKKNEAQKTAMVNPSTLDTKFGTVGCVALDQNGSITAGTSTGGMTNKRWDRIGDSPIIGAGTYANNATCGVSCTGWGEFFIRGVVAYDISAMMEYKGLSLQEAAREVIQNKVPKMGGDGGIIAIDKAGNIVWEFNTPGMFRASKKEGEDIIIEMFSK